MENDEKNIVEKEDNLSLDEGDNLVVLKKEIEYLYESSLPHPSIIKGYGEIDSKFPEELMKMTKANNRAEIWKGILEQILPFVITLFGLGTSAYLATIGFNTGAIITALGGISAPIIFKIIVNIQK